jgi:uncharacterized repeat protein (TIGR01451 family)
MRKAGPGSLMLGQTASFTLTAHNLGSAAVTAADGVTIFDTLPLNFAQVEAAGAGWTCTVTSGSPTLVSCLYIGPPVSPQAPMPSLTILGAAITEGQFLNCALIARRAGQDINPADNRGCTEGRVRPEGQGFDVGISNRPGGPTLAGQAATLLLKAYNTGTATVTEASGVVVTDVLPATFLAVQAGGPGWTCSATGSIPHTVSCAWGGPPVAGNSAFPPITVSARPRARGAFVNCAEIELKAETDLNPRDNRACTQGEVTQ